MCFRKCIFLAKGVERAKLMAGHQEENRRSSRQEMVGGSQRQPWGGAGAKRSAKIGPGHGGPDGDARRLEQADLEGPPREVAELHAGNHLGAD